jgi:hypothetical protein
LPAGRAATIVRESVDRLRRLIEQLLEIARLGWRPASPRAAACSGPSRWASRRRRRRKTRAHGQ